MLYTGSVGELVALVGFMAYVFFYLVGLIYFVWRSIRGHTFLTIFEIALSVVLAMAGSTIVFIITATGFI